MRVLNLENKSAFSSMTPFVIYDQYENVFYDSTFTDHIANGERLVFNLPAGKYLYEGSFTKMDGPIKVKNIDLPPKERNYKQKKYKIVFGDNPRKCTIFYKTGIILFDKVFQTAPIYCKYFIYFHELGHLYYKTEKYADLYSAMRLLQLGFNPSQIGRAELICLNHPQSIERKQFLIDNLLNS